MGQAHVIASGHTLAKNSLACSCIRPMRMSSWRSTDLHMLQNFWGGLEGLHVGHTAVTDELQSSALQRIVSLARNVQRLDVASVEELVSKLSADTVGTIGAYQLMSCVATGRFSVVIPIPDQRWPTTRYHQDCVTQIEFRLQRTSHSRI